jgi:hypothetical protein
MSLMISKREAVMVNTNQSKTLVRAHLKVHYPKGCKVPLVLDRDQMSPFAIQVIGVIEVPLRSIDNARAKEAGFRDQADFMAHWLDKLYGTDGLDPKSGGDRKRPDARCVVYRYKKTDFSHKRLKVGN